jgi:DNA ligase-1
LEKTSSSLKMIDILADYFKKISPEEAKISAYLIRGELAPSYLNINLGLAKKLVSRAISKATQKPIKEIEKMMAKRGDLGDVAFELLKENKGKSISLKEVFESLNKIATSTGEGSQELKINTLAELLKSSSALEAKYITRLTLGTLRLGVGEMTFLYGLSKSLTGTKEKKRILEHAYNVLSDLGEVAYQAIKRGIDALEGVSPIVGVPVRMMLAQRIKELNEVKKHISHKLIVEYKYDGERIQAHIKDRNKIILFSRRHENITNQFPDVIQAIKKNFKGKSAIVEGEVVAIDKKTKKLLNFQTLMTRRRKYNVEEYIKKVPVKYFLFDIILKDNKSLISTPLIQRKEILKKSFSEDEMIGFSEGLITDDIEKVKAFFLEVVKEGAEGIMIKDEKSVYQAGVRGWHWIKFKKEYEKGLMDTFDLVVVGGIYGSGKRAGVYGSLLVSAFDPKTNKYYSFTKVGAGFTDEDLLELPKILNQYKIKEKHHLVETNMDADVWFEPKVVIEVSGAEMTISPIHTVCKDKIKKGGLALRFPRFIRLRKDKSPEDATTVEEIYQIYKSRK